MSNSTSGNFGETLNLDENSSYYGNDDKVKSVLSILLTIISSYILIAQVFFCAVWYYSRKESRSFYKTLSNVLCVFASSMTFLRVGIPLEWFVTSYSNSTCTMYYDFQASTYGLAYIMLWTLLWLRQRYFYHSSVLQMLYSMFIRIVSNGIGIVVVLGVVASTIHYFITRSYIGTPEGCIEAIASDDLYIWALDFSSIFLSQSILMALFVYPLWKHKRRISKNNAGTPQRSNTNSSLTHAMIRSTFTSGICMALNLISIPIQYIFAKQFGAVFDVLYNLSLLMQLVAVIAIFKNWRQRFFPWLMLRGNARRQEISSGVNNSVQPSENGSRSRAGTEYTAPV